MGSGCLTEESVIRGVWHGLPSSPFVSFLVPTFSRRASHLENLRPNGIDVPLTLVFSPLDPFLVHHISENDHLTFH